MSRRILFIASEAHMAMLDLLANEKGKRGSWADAIRRSIVNSTYIMAKREIDGKQVMFYDPKTGEYEPAELK